MNNRFLKDYFSFTIRERNAVLVLMALVALFFVIPLVVPESPRNSSIREDSVFVEKATRLRAFTDTVYRQKYYAETNYRRYPPRRYYNSNYRRSPNSNYDNYPEHREAAASRPRPEIAVVDINAADTADFLPLPGIGPTLAARIISFRNKLGGFYSIDQVAETYGLPDSTFTLISPKLKLGEKPPALININTVDKESLRQHPYFRWNLANAIVEYRNSHGDFKKLSDLLHIDVITPELYEKLVHYLVIER
ncbi:MAG: helix-hairpin-helix domain-containing protein [Chitinophagaceae bacterium]|nr:helix-hairpin-helix domain-containing protein [Chitinophagaceae bacterium]